MLPDRSTDVLRGVERPVALAAPMLQGAWRAESALKTGQLVLGLGTCVMSDAAEILSGAAIPLAASACRKLALKPTVVILEEQGLDARWTTGLQTADTALLAAGCAIPGPHAVGHCVDIALTVAATFVASADDEIASREDVIRRVDDALRQSDGIGRAFESAGVVFLPVTPGGSIEIDGTPFDVEPFYIAKHETTNAQYDALAQAADGFDNAAWWADMPEVWSEPPFNSAPDAPRDRVGWYEAVAFTRWLKARMAAKNTDTSSGGLLVNGVEWEVRLPAEWEWQWAAQGGVEGRDYPWGHWQEGHANTSEAGVRATTAVGSYPLGAAVSGGWTCPGMCGNGASISSTHPTIRQ